MILEMGKKLREKKISSVELTTQFLKRARADKTNAFLMVDEEGALKAAKKADENFAKQKSTSVLDGIPIAIKDILCTRGLRTTCASKILENYVPPYNATVVEKLQNSGAVNLGKLNMDEFAMGGSNENSAFGPVLNPVNLQYVAGGSSGGSAAAVKAGLAFGTLGTDTGGSVRLPAAYTGIVGLKPTYGTVSRYGLIAFSSSLDQIGPLALTVEDCAIVYSAITGHDSKDSTSSPKAGGDFLEKMKSTSGKKYTFGMPKEYFIGGTDPAISEGVEKVRKALEAAGHKMVEVSLPHTQYSVAVYYIVAVSEASSNLSRFDGVRFGFRAPNAQSLTEMYKKSRAAFGPEVKRRILLGTFALSSGYYDAYFRKACQVRHLIKQDFDRAFEKVDMILAPVTPSTGYKLGEKTADPLKMYLNDIFTIPANLAGLPAISVPGGRDSKGLPIGIQFIGKRFAESDLFTAARFVEQNVYHEPIPAEVAHVVS